MKKLLMVLVTMLIAAMATAQVSCCPLKDNPMCCAKTAALSAVDDVELADGPSLGAPQGITLASATYAPGVCNIENCPLKGSPLCPLGAAMTGGQGYAGTASSGGCVPTCCLPRK